MSTEIISTDFRSAERLSRERGNNRPFMRYLHERYAGYDATPGLVDIVEYAMGLSDRKPGASTLSPKDEFWRRTIMAIKSYDSDVEVGRPDRLGTDCDFLHQIRVPDQWSLLHEVAFYLLRQIRPNRTVAAVLMATDEGVSLLEFVAHYRAIGVEKIFIYTNRNSDGSELLLDSLCQFDDIQVIYNETLTDTNVQSKVLQHSVFCLPGLRDFKWALYVDADEFLIPAASYDYNLLNLIEALEHQTNGAPIAAVLFPWNWRLYTREVKRQASALLENFPYAVPHTLFKSLVSMAQITSMADVHFPRFDPDAFAVDSAFNHLPGTVFWADYAKTAEGGRIEHFWGRSFAEFMIKKRRSEAFQQGSRDYDLYFGWTAPYRDEYFDPIAPTMINRTRASLAELMLYKRIADAQRDVEHRYRAVIDNMADDVDLVRLFGDLSQKITPSMAPPRQLPSAPSYPNDAALQITELLIMQRAWRFGRADGTTIARNVRLKRFGHVLGHDNENEFGWIIRDGRLEFQTAEGKTTCRFTAASLTAQGKLVMAGRLDGSDIMHVLEESHLTSQLGAANRDPKVAVLVRTHLMNDKLLDLLDVLNQSRRFDLFVSADETRTTIDCGGYTKLPHNTELCAQFGLAANHERILWLCGDYPLYFARAEIPDYDYYIMIEYDVDFVRKSPLFLEGLISRLQPPDRPAFDLVTASLNRANPDWGWYRSAHMMFPEVYESGIFAFVAMSGRAVDHLYATRRTEAEQGRDGSDIIHCEAFCASALAAADYHCADIGTLVEGAIDLGMFHPPVLDFPNSQYLLDDYRPTNPRVEIVHPVFDIDGYLEREYHKALHHGDTEPFITRLMVLAKGGLDKNIVDGYLEMVVGHHRQQRGTPD